MWIVWYKLNGELHRISCGCGNLPVTPGAVAWDISATEPG